MKESASPKIICKYCPGGIEQGKLFCIYCGCDRFFGIKKWEYLLGGLLLLMVFSVIIMGVNTISNSIKSIPDSPTQIVVHIPSPTSLPPSPQSFESLPSTPIPPPTEIILTSIPIPTSCSEVTITTTDTPKGDTLHIERCSDGWKYDTSPIAKGVYAMASNNKFLVYCTNDGYVYAVRIGDSNFKFIENIRKKMPIFRQNEDVSLVITFLSGENQYWAKIKDRISGQSAEVKIPLTISH